MIWDKQSDVEFWPQNPAQSRAFSISVTGIQVLPHKKLLCKVGMMFFSFCFVLFSTSCSTNEPTTWIDPNDEKIFKKKNAILKSIKSIEIQLFVAFVWAYYVFLLRCFRSITFYLVQTHKECNSFICRMCVCEINDINRQVKMNTQ